MRRIRQNIWGNWRGYEGRKVVKDFGTDEIEAKAWLDDPEKWEAELKAELASGLKLRDFKKEFLQS